MLTPDQMWQATGKKPTIMDWAAANGMTYGEAERTILASKHKDLFLMRKIAKYAPESKEWRYFVKKAISENKDTGLDHDTLLRVELCG